MKSLRSLTIAAALSLPSVAMAQPGPFALCVPLYNATSGAVSCVPVGQTSPNITTPNPLPVGGVANAAAPTFTEGRYGYMSFDLAGNLRVLGTFTPSGSSPEFTPVAPGAATATHGVLLGGQYDSTQKTLTDGQQAAGSFSARGALFVAKGADGFTIDNTTFGATQATAANLNATVVGTGTFVVQGTDTVSSATVPVSTMNSSSANTGLNTALAAVFDDVSPTAITENNFGFLRMSANRNLYGTIRDAAGNERGANVDASNRLTTAPTMVSGSVASGAIASGAVASGAVASGAYASGALASGSIASGAMVDLVALSAPVAPATATATKSVLLGAQATTAAVNPTTGQQGALSSDTNNNLLVSAGGAPNLSITQVSIATSDTLAIAARALRRAVTIQQITGTQNVFCNQTTATSANGVVLPAVVGASITLNTTSAVRCIAITGAQTVAVAETY